ncbi:MAG: cadmium-translocating P-type ATPase [Chlorobi bacterium]|nr:cadmium-translocating P-type ATPase [Chlorobiota bacterium]
MAVCEFRVEGMDCPSCAKSIETFLKSNGAEEVYVDVIRGYVKVNGPGDCSKYAEHIETLGYKVLKKSEKPRFTLLHYAIFATVFTLPLWLAMFIPALRNPWLHAFLATPVFLLGWYLMGKAAYKSVRVGAPNMDVLVLLGTTAAYIYSWVMLFKGGDIYFETAAGIITLILWGKYIEHRATAKTRDAIEQLTALLQGKARVLLPDGTIKEIDFEEVKEGDRIIVAEGEKVPTDGVVIEGSALVDESFLTGESTPVLKKVGDKVYGGTVVVDGSIVMEAEAVGSKTVLAEIIRIAEEAQQTKPSLQRLADRISAWFVPIVLLISLIVFGIWYFLLGSPIDKALLNAVAVLVIACPCALGLATPAAIAVGVGLMAKKGILVKNADVFEILPHIKRVVFDKTGTLTTGKFKITHWETNINPDEFKSLVVSIEKHSIHPIAKSIVEEWGTEVQTLVEFEEVREERGEGIYARLKDGKRVFVGRTHSDNGHADISVQLDGKEIGHLKIGDDIKPEAKEVIDWFKKKGIEPILLTGDKKEKALMVAKKLGIEKVYYETHPGDKLRIIQELNREVPTAMVGDGINDAPALMAAAVSFSFSSATDIARNSAHIVLLSDSLLKVKEAWILGIAIYKTIWQNLFWAFAYNSIAIPIAGAGYLSPTLAALSMAFSDVVLIINSVRLYRYKNKII